MLSNSVLLSSLLCTAYIHPDIHLSLLIAYRLKLSSLTNSETSLKLGLVLYDWRISTLPSGFSNRACQSPGNDYINRCVSLCVQQDEHETTKRKYLLCIQIPLISSSNNILPQTLFCYRGHKM